LDLSQPMLQKQVLHQSFHIMLEHPNVWIAPLEEQISNLPFG
jgi:hypothetical protein